MNKVSTALNANANDNFLSCQLVSTLRGYLHTGLLKGFGFGEPVKRPIRTGWKKLDHTRMKWKLKPAQTRCFINKTVPFLWSWMFSIILQIILPPKQCVNCFYVWQSKFLNVFICRGYSQKPSGELLINVSFVVSRLVLLKLIQIQ